jgi:lipopolysaccharide biosynthesis glycosyltransferase
MLAVCFITNERHLSLAVVAARQAEKFKSSADIHIFIEDAGFDLARLEVLSRQHAHHFHLNELSRFIPDGLPQNERWPSLTFGRLFLANVLQGYDRILYLDNDILVVRDYSKLVDIEFGDAALAAVTDFSVLYKISDPEKFGGMQWSDWFRRIGKKHNTYFNSGVLLINPSKWLAEKPHASLNRFFSEYGYWARMYDQDFLNWFFDGKWLELSPRWNFPGYFFGLGFEDTLKPTFLHFYGSRVPWRNFPFQVEHRRFARAYASLCEEVGLQFSDLPNSGYSRDIVWGYLQRIYLKLLSFVFKPKLALRRWKRRSAVLQSYFDDHQLFVDGEVVASNRAARPVYVGNKFFDMRWVKDLDL